MRELKTVLLLWTLLAASAVVLAQTREPGTSEMRTDVPQTQQAGEVLKPSDPPLTKDALSTNITSARVELGPGDQLAITVFDTPELTQTVRVNSDGKISLALIGEITVQGFSPDALAKLIRLKLVDGRFMKDPQVSVFVVEYAGQMAYVTGEVARPGAYPLLRSHHLLDIISFAGGLTMRAGNEVTIAREGDSSRLIRVDLGNKDEDLRNPEILPGDSITVGQTGIVYVLGDVARPGGFLLDRRSTLTVMQALALAEGVLPSAAVSKALLVRTTEGNRQETPLNLKLILKSQNPDPMVQSGDIIIVPSSLLHGMGRRSIEILESSAGLAAVYAGH